MVEAVQLVEDGDGEDFFVGEVGEVHRWGEEVGAGGGDVDEAAAFGDEGEPMLLGGVDGGWGFVVRVVEVG